MAPAEIWQAGKMVNKIQRDNTHEGVLRGKRVLVKDSDPGCKLDGIVGYEYINVGNSITLDSGEVIKSVRK